MTEAIRSQIALLFTSDLEYQLAHIASVVSDSLEIGTPADCTIDEHSFPLRVLFADFQEDLPPEFVAGCGVLVGPVFFHTRRPTFNLLTPLLWESITIVGLQLHLGRQVEEKLEVSVPALLMEHGDNNLLLLPILAFIECLEGASA